MTAAPTLLWLRRDLRLADNPALTAAARDAGPLLPVYVWDDADRPWAPGGASRWWTWHSLRSLAADLERRGASLIVRRGSPLDELAALAAETGARSLHLTATLDPGELDEPSLSEQFAARGAPLEVTVHGANLLFGPPFPTTAAGRPFHVFTPFWKACRATDEPDTPLPVPAHLRGPTEPPASLSLDELRSAAVHAWADGLAPAWSPGEAGARRRLDAFLDDPLRDYGDARDLPDGETTSRLSPHLHFGEISARMVWHAARDAAGAAAEPFLRQLAWRDFAHLLLLHHPATPDEPLRPQFADFPWRRDPDALAAWRRGHTGYPLVDAGLRQLWETGWMHNRVRLVCASFLTKHLLIPWQEGARWFWDTLVDADLADNTLGWQWTAGCGADAAPYFRIFNPFAQGRRFDPDGAYVRRWLPELGRLPNEHVHTPWLAPETARRDAGLRLASPDEVARLTADDHGPRQLGDGLYPEPLVDHAVARRRAIEAYDLMKQRAEAAGDALSPPTPARR